MVTLAITLILKPRFLRDTEKRKNSRNSGFAHGKLKMTQNSEKLCKMSNFCVDLQNNTKKSDYVAVINH